MKAHAKPPRSTVLCASLLLASTGTSAEPATSAAAARHWVEGELEQALAVLEKAAPTREVQLNGAIVRLYAGRADDALPRLVTLRDRERGWTQPLRWLARTQATLDQPEALETAGALIAQPDADVLDRLWAGTLFLRHGRARHARSAFQAVVRWNAGLDVGWRGLAAAQAQLGELEPARVAEARALALSRGSGGGEAAGGEATPERSRPTVALKGAQPFETLRYEVRYLFLRLATVGLETRPDYHRGRPVRRVVFTAKSDRGVPFFHIDSRFQSLIGEEGAVVAHRHVANDSDNGADEAGYDMDAASGRCTVRTARDGAFGFHVLPLPANAQDGVSVLLVARALARERGTMVVPTAVDCMWWPTRLRTVGVEQIRWHGRPVRAVHVQSFGHYRGAGGVSGLVDVWFSDDERALPYRVKMKVAVGSVVLELVPDAAAGGAR